VVRVHSWIGVAGVLCLMALAAGVGCTTSGDDDAQPAAGTGVPLAGSIGAGGMAGTTVPVAGAGGMAGSLGSAGSAGSVAAGTGGAAGSVAMAGTGGAAGSMMAGSGGAAGSDMAGSGGSGDAGTQSGAFELTSTAFQDGDMIPAMYRCASLFGDPGPSPPLAWTAGPAGTMSYTLVLKDTSPSTVTGAGFFHWIIADIPAGTMSLPMAVPVGAMPAMPAGAKQVPNGLSNAGYLGPCGSSGTNNYTFTLYAVNMATLPDTSSADATEAAAIANNVGTATLAITSMP